MKHKIIFLNGHGLYDSTLLIPKHYKDFFHQKVKEFGGVSKLFNFMVNCRHPFFDYRPLSDTGKTSYCPVGQNLQRVNFRPRNEDWEKFRIIAFGRRISMSFLFVLLLMNWDAFETVDSRVPVPHNKITLLTSLSTGPAYTKIHLIRRRI